MKYASVFALGLIVASMFSWMGGDYLNALKAERTFNAISEANARERCAAAEAAANAWALAGNTERYQEWHGNSAMPCLRATLRAQGVTGA